MRFNNPKNKKSLWQTIALVSLLFSYSNVFAQDFLICFTTKKIDPDNVYTEKHLKKYRPHTKINFIDDEIYLHRCSYSDIRGQVTCDRYKVDHVAKDNNVGITKFYYFRGQADLQFYENSMMAIENNGRGAISYQACVIN